MTPFFETCYTVQRPCPAVFDFVADFDRYFDQLPAFRDCELRGAPGPPVEGKEYQLCAPGDRALYRTRIVLIEIDAPRRFVYEYDYLDTDTGRPLTGSASPMPWDRARMLLTFSDAEGGTRVDSRMAVRVLPGLLSRWRTARLRRLAVRAQAEANRAMVSVVEQAL